MQQMERTKCQMANMKFLHLVKQRQKVSNDQLCKE